MGAKNVQKATDVYSLLQSEFYDSLSQKTECNGEHFKTKQSKNQGKGENIEKVPLIFAHSWAKI